MRPSTTNRRAVVLANPTATCRGPSAPVLSERRLTTARASVHSLARAELAVTPVVHLHASSLKEMVDCGAFRGATVVRPAQPPAVLYLRPPGGKLKPGHANAEGDAVYRGEFKRVVHGASLCCGWAHRAHLVIRSEWLVSRYMKATLSFAYCESNVRSTELARDT